jgi:hypothetical protein
MHKLPDILYFNLLSQKNNMKKITYALLLAAIAALPSCKKSHTLVTVVVPNTVATYTVDGLTDVVLEKYTSSSTSIVPVTFSYHDSAQEAITVSISGVPKSFDIYTNAGSSRYTGPWTGIPTFTIPLTFTINSATYTPGQYPIALTCISASGKMKTFTFNVTCR